MRQVVLDCETTGLEPEAGHRIVEIGCVEITDRAIGQTFHRFVNPERQSDKQALEVHQLSDEVLKTKPLFREIWEELHQFIKGSELIIHNASFDIAFLNAELQLMGLGELTEVTGCTICDTLELARSMHPSLKNNLNALSDRYAIDRSQRDQRHGALLDADLLAKVFLAMTGGQSAMDLSSEEEEILALNEVNIVVDGDFPVVYASDAELAAHQQLMEWIRTQPLA